MSMVKHVVLLRFRRDTPQAQIKAIFRNLDELRQKIPGMLDFSGGAYSSPEGLNKGFTHGFVTAFADEESRDAYLSHPDHEAVKRLVIPWLEGGFDGAIAFDWRCP